MTLTATTTTTTNTNAMKVPEVNTTQLQALAEVCSSVTGVEQMTSIPNIVMNSLVSPTKVVTNDSLPHPIVTTNISLPSFPVPVSSIGIPIMNMKSDETINAEIALEEEEKKDEPMPSAELLDDDSILQMAAQIEDNIAEADVDVNVNVEAKDKLSEIVEEIGKEEKLIINGIGTFISNNVGEPMECVPTTNTMPSPKHGLVNDVHMLEHFSVILNCICIPIIRFRPNFDFILDIFNRKHASGEHRYVIDIEHGNA